jgi:hypothetical protein
MLDQNATTGRKLAAFLNERLTPSLGLLLVLLVMSLATVPMEVRRLVETVQIILGE